MRARPRAGSCFTFRGFRLQSLLGLRLELLSGMRNMPLDLDGFVFRGVARFQFGVELSHMRKLIETEVELSRVGVMRVLSSSRGQEEQRIAVTSHEKYKY